MVWFHILNWQHQEFSLAPKPWLNQEIIVTTVYKTSEVRVTYGKETKWFIVEERIG
jgi:hypothetical protein